MQITQELLHQLFNYNPLTGIFSFKERTPDLQRSSKDDIRWNKRYAGKTAGFNHHAGYLSISVYGKQVLAHRMAYLYMYGVEPELIDHANQNKKDNRICNLRAATKSGNACNSRVRSDNKSGIKGVCFCNRDKKWRARIALNGVEYSLGMFSTASEAAEVVKLKRIELHGAFASEGK